MAGSCDAAITAFRQGRLRKLTYISSSMVYENADTWPSVKASRARCRRRFCLRVPEAGRRVFRPGCL